MLWGYAITGIVGIVGTGLGARLTGRWQTENLQLSLNVESKRAQRVEKVQVYMAFHSAFHAFWVIASSTVDRDEEPVRSIYDATLTTYRDASDRVSMMAPTEVSDLMIQLSIVTDKYLDEVELVESDDEVPFPGEKFHAIRRKLINAMRKDLEISH